MAKKEILNSDAVTIRVSEEAVEIGEKVVDAAENAVEAVEKQVERIVTVTKNNPAVLVGVFVVGAAIGGFAAYKFVEKKMATKFEAELDQQIAEAKAFYKGVNKEGEFVSPESAVQALVPEEVVEAVNSYQGREKKIPYNKPETVVVEDPRPPVEVVVEQVEVKQNVFVNAATDPRDWDYNAELADRELNPDQPYTISFEEHSENPDNNEQVTFTYYALDETLADEQEKPIDNIEYTVGEDNLLRFGHGSHDANVVYVRNEKLGIDFEIVRSEGSYKRDVLGFPENDEEELTHSHRRPNRRRWRTDE